MTGHHDTVLPFHETNSYSSYEATIWTKVAAEMKSNVVLVAAKQRYRVPAETWQSSKCPYFPSGN